MSKKPQPMNPDSESVYDAEIAPLMSKIIDICKANRIPMLATFQYSNDDDGSDFCTTRIPFAGESGRLEIITAIMLGDA